MSAPNAAYAAAHYGGEAAKAQAMVAEAQRDMLKAFVEREMLRTTDQQTVARCAAALRLIRVGVPS